MKFFGKVLIVGSMIFCQYTAAKASEIANATAPSGAGFFAFEGFTCVGPYTDAMTCIADSAEISLDDSIAGCLNHDGLSSYSAEACAYYEAPTFQDESSKKLLVDTCPQPGGASGWYSRTWYYCNGN